MTLNLTKTGRPAEFAVQANSAVDPTTAIYAEFLTAFRFFNERLFRDRLPGCLFSYTRRPVLGHFCAEAVRNDDGLAAHEIAINPVGLAVQSPTEALSTVCHEMCHFQRHLDPRRNRKGGKGARGYHDMVWADAMEAIGLIPSTTGAPGGRRTGFSVSHYVVDGGPFDLACREFLISGAGLTWRDDRLLRKLKGDADLGVAPVDPTAVPPASPTRSRFVCPDCGQKAWARVSAQLACVPCNLALIAS